MDSLRTAAVGRAVDAVCAPIDGRVVDPLRTAAVRSAPIAVRAPIDGHA